MENKTHWKKMTNPKYVGAHDVLPQTQFRATIDRVVHEMVPDTSGKESECVVCYFVGKKKPMILNKTNLKIIEKALKTPYVEEWAGREILVIVAKVRAFGENVDALRVKNEFK